MVGMMMVISFLIAFSFSFVVGLLTFWVEEVWGLQNVKDVSIVLLGGVALPYYFFPITLQKILVFTPYPYLVNWPLRKGFSGNLLLEFIMAVFWLVTFLLLGQLLWKKGLKKYSALGTY
jgi:ABC-2 type transport system permease protein